MPILGSVFADVVVAVGAEVVRVPQAVYTTRDTRAAPTPAADYGVQVYPDPGAFVSTRECSVAYPMKQRTAPTIQAVVPGDVSVLVVI